MLRQIKYQKYNGIGTGYNLIISINATIQVKKYYIIDCNMP